ncbi:MAG: hypothetical protein NUV94_05705 [Candidatus Acetothermia bacterium]|jgi:hypothetical protein|nr:hypothetical protein [Candidatus Acetothermia bacterium]
MRKRAVLWGMVVLVTFAAMAQAPVARPSLGVGMQSTLPAVFGISVRYWATPDRGFEGDLFLITFDGQPYGMAAARALARAAATESASFYVAGGASLLFPDENFLAHLCGGIELALPFAPSLALNTEFGLTWARDGGWGMAFGTGIHFYFGL